LSKFDRDFYWIFGPVRIPVLLGIQGKIFATEFDILIDLKNGSGQNLTPIFICYSSASDIIYSLLQITGFVLIWYFFFTFRQVQNLLLGKARRRIVFLAKHKRTV